MKSLFNAYWAFTKNLEKGIKKYGLNSGNPKILLYLLGNEGCRQIDISRNCQVSSATLSSVLANMEANGIIERKRVEENKRSYAIYLTKKGHQTFDVIKDQLDATTDIAFRGFSDEEINDVQSYLNRITVNLNNLNN